MPDRDHQQQTDQQHGSSDGTTDHKKTTGLDQQADAATRRALSAGGDTMVANKNAHPPPAPNPKPENQHAPQAKYGAVHGVVSVQGPGDKSAFAPGDVRQGSLGDCYFVSQLAAEAQFHPEVLEKVIRDNGDETYSVTFYMKQWLTRVPKTIVVDSQFPQNNGSTAYAKPGTSTPKGPELWPMILEKAYAAFVGSYAGIEGGVTPDGDVFGLLTGKDSFDHSIDSMSPQEIEGTLAAAIGGSRPVDLFSRDDEKDKTLGTAMRDAGVVGDHGYTVMSYDKQSKKVTLRNPWGYQDPPPLTADQVKKFFYNIKVAAP